jgi:hypothetical protein
MASPATPQDPAGLLNRITELRILCSDARVARALASGNPFKVYRALFWARLTGRLGAHRRTVEQLLRNRRAFARPLRGKPWLGTLNGFGATFLGSAEAEPDGTRIATHALVLLFAVPLFPLGAYVVSHAGRSGLSTQWRVFARVPLGGLAWAWSRLVSLGIAAAVLAAGQGALHAARHHDLHVVNGFAQPVQVTIGPASFAIPAGGHDRVNLPVGTHTARATAGGVVVDEAPLEVGTGSDLQIWNVAGGAPVMVRQVSYYSGTPPANAKEPDPVLHCGERRISLGGIDYEFTEPPRRLSVPKGAGLVTKRVVSIAEEKGADGTLLCGFLLLQKKALPGALAILEQRARASGWAPEPTQRALWGAAQLGLKEEIRIARAARDAHPDDVPVNRTYQDLALDSEEAAAVREEYRRRAQAAPGSPAAQYLHGRLLPDEAQLQRFPDDPHLLRLVTGLRSEREDWPGVDRAWRALRARSAAGAGEMLDVEARALLSQRRPADALRAIEELFSQLEPGARGEAALLYARVAARGGAAGPGRLIDQLDEGERPLLRAQAGLDSGEEAPSPAILVLRAAASDPRDALTRVAEAGTALLPQLDADTLLLLYGEAMRSGHPAQQVLETLMRGAPEYLEPFRRFVRGELDGAARLRPQMRAAAELVRSRVKGLPAAERSALRAAALRDDVLGTVVSRAARAWPEPER